MEKEYQEVDGTFYDKRTNKKVVEVLERVRKSGVRITIDLGDVKTGKSWNETYDVSGRVGRSTGKIKIPLLIHNSRSIGGGAILDHCIIGIKESKGGKVLYSFEL